MAGPKRHAFILPLLMLAFAFEGMAPPASGDTGAWVEGEVIVRFRAGAESRREVSEDTRVLAVTPLDPSGIDLVRVAGMTTADAVAWLGARPDVVYAEPNYRIFAEAAPNDSLFPSQWGLDNRGQTGGTPGADIGAVRAWDLVTGSRDVVVGIVDSGMDLTHPDLAPQLWTNVNEIPGNGLDDDGNDYVDDVHGWDFADNDNDPTDTYGHGTAVAGVIGAVGNDGGGVAGVCWRVSLMPLRVINSTGTGDLTSAIRAVAYATRMGVRLTNNSWGRVPESNSLRDVIDQARERGVLFVAAAGNGGLDDDVEPHFPSAFPLDNIVAVAATDENDRLARFSNFGAISVDLAAPGSAIISTFTQGGFITLSGTSLSTPFVSGALALAFARAPHITPGALRDALFASVDPKPTLIGVTSTGGRLNVRRLVESLDVVPPEPIAGLQVDEVQGTRVALRWVAPADDGGGPVSSYDVRYAPGPLDAAGLDQAASVPFPGPSAAPGQTERLVVEGLAYHTGYTFAVRAADEHGNRSTEARFVTATTIAPPIAVVTAEPLDVSADPGGVAERALTIENRGSSELHYSFEVRQAVSAPALSGRGTMADDRENGIPTVRARPVRLTSGDALRVVLLENGASLHALGDALRREGLEVDELRLDQTPTLTLETLLPYDAVVLVPFARLNDRSVVGDVLADFADAGGGVVLTHSVFLSTASIGGRLATSFLPLAPGDPRTDGGVLVVNSNHPVLHGVRLISSVPVYNVSLAPGATALAKWPSGVPCVATKGNNVVALDIAYETGAWGGDAIRMLASASRWSAHGTSWLSVDAASGVVPPGGVARRVVRFGSGVINGETRRAQLVVHTDDPASATVALSARLTVSAAPALSLDGEVVVRDVQGTAPALAPIVSIDVPERRGSRGIAEYFARARVPFTGTMRLDGTPIATVPYTFLGCVDRRVPFAVDSATLAGALSDRHLVLELQTPTGGVACGGGYFGMLYYVTPSDTLEFKDGYVGIPNVMRILVQNTGRAPLVLTSIRTGDPELTPLAGSITCAPGLSALISVRFLSSIVGPHDTALRFETNDPRRPTVEIPIRARSVPRAILRIDTPIVSAVLFSGGATTVPVRLTNLGSTPLTFRIELPVMAEMQVEGGPSTAAAAGWLRAPAPTGTVDVGRTVEVPLVLDAAGLPKGLNTAVLSLVTNDPFASRVNVTARLQVLGWPRRGLGGLPIDVESAQEFEPPSGDTRHAQGLEPPPAAWADLEYLVQGDSPDGSSYARVEVGTLFRIDLKGVAHPCEPQFGGARFDSETMASLMENGAVEVRIVRTGPASACAPTRNIVRWHYPPRVDSIALGEVPVGVERRTPLIALNGGDAALRMRIASADARVTVTPDTVDVPPNGAQVFTVAFTPDVVGDVSIPLSVESNDPAHRHEVLPFRANGVPAPRVEVDTRAIALDVGPGEPARSRVLVRNTGSGPLTLAARAAWDGWGGAAGSGGVMGAGSDAGSSTPEDLLDTDVLPASPFSLACFVGDPESGDLYGVELNGTRFARFQPSTSEWVDVTACPAPPNEFTSAVLLHGKMYVASLAGFGRSLTLQVFDLTTETWSTLKVSGVGATGGLTTDGRRYLYLVDDFGLLRLDPETGTETALGPSPIDHASGAVLRYFGDALLAYGTGNPSAVLYRYDLATASWSQTPPPPGVLGLGGAIDPVHGEFVAPSFSGELHYRLNLVSGAWRTTRLPYFTARFGVMTWLPGDAAGLYFSEGLGQRLARERHGEVLAPFPRTSTVPPGGETEVEVVVRPAGLRDGIRGFDLILSTDDPHAREIAIPVTVTVATRPRLELGGAARAGALAVSHDAGVTLHALPLVASPAGPAALRVFEANRIAGAPPGVVSVEGRPVASLVSSGVGCRDASVTATLDLGLVAEAARSGTLPATVTDPPCGAVRRWVQCSYPAAGLPWTMPETAVGDTARVRLRITNSGTAPLAVGRVTTDRSDLRVIGSPSVLAAGRDAAIELVWAPSAPGTLAATLTIESSEPGRPRVTGSVSGRAVLPPLLWVDPERLDVHLVPGSVQTRRVLLANVGARSLIWSARVLDPGASSPPKPVASLDPAAPARTVSATAAGIDASNPREPGEPGEPATVARGGVARVSAVSWAVLEPEAGTVLPGDTAQVSVTLDAHGLANGWHDTRLTIESNDRAHPQTIVPVRAFVGPLLAVGLRIEPRALQPRSHGRWVKARIALPAGVTGRQVLTSSVRLNDRVAPSAATNSDDDGDDGESKAVSAHDHGSHDPDSGDPDSGDPDHEDPRGTKLSLSFDRAALIATLPPAGRAEVRVRGELVDGRRFEGRDTVRLVGRGEGDHEDQVDAAPSPILALALDGAAPNPFARETRVGYALPRAAWVRIEVFDLAGRRIRHLENGPREPGRYAAAWDGRDAVGHEVPAGVYVVRLQASGAELRRRVVRSP